MTLVLTMRISTGGSTALLEVHDWIVMIYQEDNVAGGR